MPGLDLSIHRLLHVVSKIIETKLVVGSICYICRVCSSLCFIILSRYDYRYCQAQEAINLTHPFSISLCKIVVDCDYMYALSFKGHKVCGGDAGKCLSFTSLHFKDGSLIKDYGTHDLFVIVSFSDASSGGFPYKSECLGENFIKASTILDLFFPFIRI